MIQQEEWIPISDTGYSISNWGKIKNLKEKILKPHLNRYGYATVNIKGKQYLVHRLVAQAFCQIDIIIQL